MKNSRFLPIVIVLFYGLIAGGSLTDFFVDFAWVIGIGIAIGIIGLIYEGYVQQSKSEKGLQNAIDLFGQYTDRIEFKKHKFILFDQKNNRVLLYNSIIDTRKLKCLNTSEKAPSTKTTYKEEYVTKTSGGSLLGRATVGAIAAGPVGAIIGGSTAKKKTETVKKAETTYISGYYTIEVLDIEDNVRATFIYSNKNEYIKVKTFLEKIISYNYEEQKNILIQNKTLIENSSFKDVKIGDNVTKINNLLLDSDFKQKSDNLKHYKLSNLAKNIVNNTTKLNSSDIYIDISNDIIVSLQFISNTYTVSTFNELLIDIEKYSKYYTNIYGKTSFYQQEISYIAFNEDCNTMLCRKWENKNSKVELNIEYNKSKYYCTIIEKLT